MKRWLAGVVGLAGVVLIGCSLGQPAGEGQKAAGGGRAGVGAPVAAKRPVVDVYHGERVVDEYRWLEDWGDPAVKAWSEGQNTYARAVLDALPGVEAIRARVTELRGAAAADYLDVEVAAGKYFALKSDPPKQQPLLVVMDGVGEGRGERVLLDPNLVDPSGGTTIDFFEPSRDGKLVAVSMSKDGSESGDVRVFETATGREVGGVVPRVNGGTAGGSVAWNADGTGFYYTRYPRPGERPEADLDFYQQVYFHNLETGEDRYEIGKDLPRIAMIELETSPDGSQVLATVANGDGGEFEHFVRMADGAWVRTTRREDGCTRAHFGAPDIVGLVSVRGAGRGQLMTVPAFDPGMVNVERVIPEAEAVIEDFVRTPTHYFVRYQAGGLSEVRVYDFRGSPEGFVPLPPVSRVGRMVADGDAVLFRCESYLLPPAWYRVTATDTSPRRTGLAKEAAVGFDDCEVVREKAVSKDGTAVPLTILRLKGTKLDGTNPTLLYGYGGYGISVMPSFSEIRRLWLERGGVLAYANTRGGGEFGREWHLGGNLLNKQNVFDDFHACMKRLVELGYCTREKLAIMGGSNGGLLMGAMITQHPGDFRAVVSTVGIYDMLRVELSPNGSFNVTEFGTVKDPAMFRAMRAYSPYHNVKDGAGYPPVLMMTGANDPRVDPMQSRKMTARLQAAGGRALLRTSANAGHGGGSSLSHRIEEDVDRYGFLFAELEGEGTGEEGTKARRHEGTK